MTLRFLFLRRQFQDGCEDVPVGAPPPHLPILVRGSFYYKSGTRGADCAARASVGLHAISTRRLRPRIRWDLLLPSVACDMSEQCTTKLREHQYLELVRTHNRSGAITSKLPPQYTNESLRCCTAGTTCAWVNGVVGCCASGAQCGGNVNAAGVSTATVYATNYATTTATVAGQNTVVVAGAPQGTTTTSVVQGPFVAASTATTTTTGQVSAAAAGGGYCSTYYANGNNLPTTYQGSCGTVLVLNDARSIRQRGFAAVKWWTGFWGIGMLIYRIR